MPRLRNRNRPDFRRLVLPIFAIPARNAHGLLHQRPYGGIHGSGLPARLQLRLSARQLCLLHQLLFQRAGQLPVPHDPQPDSHLPIPDSAIIPVQPDRQFLSVYHGIRPAAFNCGFVADLYLVPAIYPKKIPDAGKQKLLNQKEFL